MDGPREHYTEGGYRDEKRQTVTPNPRMCVCKMVGFLNASLTLKITWARRELRDWLDCLHWGGKTHSEWGWHLPVGSWRTGGRVFTVCSLCLPLPVEWIYQAYPDSFADNKTHFSRLPAWTEEQWESKSPPVFLSRLWLLRYSTL